MAPVDGTLAAILSQLGQVVVRGTTFKQMTFRWVVLSTFRTAGQADI